MLRFAHLAALLGIAFATSGCLGEETCADAVPCPGSYDIHSLSDLKVIARCESLSGDLLIEGHPWFTIAELECLTSVDGDLTVRDAEVEIEVEPFFTDTVVIPAMTHVGLPDLTSVGGSLEIHTVDVLSSLDLSALTSVGSLYVSGTALTSLDLSALTSTSDDLFIGAPLTSLDMPALVTVGGSLGFMSGSLANLDFPALTSVDGNVTLEFNPSLTSIQGLSSLASVDGVFAIEELASLSNVGGLSSFVALEGDLRIRNNPVLLDLEGLSHLESVGGDLRIHANSDLASLEGLSALGAVDADLFIRNNSCLEPVEAEEFAATLDVGGDTTVENNGANYPCD